MINFRRTIIWPLLLVLAGASHFVRADCEQQGVRRLLYVASPGVRDYQQWGGHGVLVFDICNGHQFVRRISLAGYGTNAVGKVLNIKGVCASAKTGRLYVSTLEQLICIDLLTDSVLWQKAFEFGCDRMSISPDGATIYLPSLEKDVWYVVNASTGEEIRRLTPKSRSHNTVYGINGKHVYLAGLGSPILTVASAKDHKIERTVGPFGNSIRPFTVNASETLVFVNVNDLAGFEIGDLTTNGRTHRVEVTGFPRGPSQRHGCPSHGIGLTPDEREIWLCDAFNRRLHIFDATVLPPQQRNSVILREEPGWVTFSIDGTYAYPSTGEVIDAKSKKIVAVLSDEEARPVHSEKMIEIQFVGSTPVANGDQFGLGRAGL